MLPHRRPTLRLLFLIAVAPLACQGEGLVEPSIGILEITVSTSGPEPDPDGYVVRVDDEPERTIDAGAALHISDVIGEHAVRLDGVAANCLVSGENPRTVRITAGDTVAVTFAITCSALGTMVAVASTTGGFADPDGYLVVVDDLHQLAIQATGRQPLGDFAAGAHKVEVREIAANCRLSGSNPRSVDVQVGGPSDVVFDIDCSAPPAIAFSSDRRGEEMIYVVNPDGSGLTMLARGASSLWSPDGTRLAFLLDEGLYVMNADGTGQNLVFTSGAWFGSVDWSPDGLSLAFTRHVSGGCDDPHNCYELWTMHTDGSGSKRLAIVTGSSGLSWSPDSRRIVFSGHVRGVSRIWIINADGTGLTQVPLENGSHPDWSPDGALIAFQHYSSGGTGIYTVHPDGAGLRSVTDGAGHYSEATWAPDGSKIAFKKSVTLPAGHSHAILGVMNADGSGRTILTDVNAGSVTTAAWSPDSRSIAFTSLDRSGDDFDPDYDPNVYVIQTDGHGLRDVSRSPSRDGAADWASR
jgi:Tol biopolymer transport system component